jgi:hypothetical protein
VQIKDTVHSAALRRMRDRGKHTGKGEIPSTKGKENELQQRMQGGKTVHILAIACWTRKVSVTRWDSPSPYLVKRINNCLFCLVHNSIASVQHSSWTH